MPQRIDAADVPALLRPGHLVYVQGACAEPLALVDALATAPDSSAGVHYVSCLVPGINETDYAGFHETARLTCFFVHGAVWQSYLAGRIRFLPLHYSGIYRFFASLPMVDLALIQVAPPDRDGNCSLGVSVDFQPAILDRAKVIVAEINRRMPSPPGSLTIPKSRLDYVVETEHRLIEYATGGISETVAAIGANVADLIEDGDCFQVGIGKVPAAIIRQLRGKRDLGLQGGMITDDMVDLVEDGVLTGARKSHDAGKHVCGSAFGTDKVYDWVAKREDVLFRPSNYTHEVRVVSRVDNFVSINSVLEVDLSGQANAEMIEGRQISGTGGLMDFVRAARLSTGGRSILALPSTAAGGTLSRIVPRLGAGAVVTCPRADIDYVVTEHGAARLSDKPLEERAEALIAIAHPDFRDDLAAEWAKTAGRATTGR